MLLSMTGFGEARYQDERLAVSVELRTVNNRYFKISIKCSDVYAPLEGDIEKTIREVINRGTVTVGIRVDRLTSSDDFVLNLTAIKSYWEQIQTAASDIHLPRPNDLGALLQLPGVVTDSHRRSVDLENEWPIIRQVLQMAVDRLQVFRAEEGRAMERDLVTNIEIIASRLKDVIVLAPQVVQEYRTKLLERIRQLLSDSDVTVQPADLIREVSIFSDRADINEEITRLQCHIEQFQSFLKEPASTGRKLEFLTQELFREINTIGSKANNVAIAHVVVEMKAAVEKIREVLQNVE